MVKFFSSSLDSDDFPDDVDQDILPHAFNDVNKEVAGEVKVETTLVEKDCPKEANNNKSMERRTVRFKSEDEAYSAVASPDTPSISQGSSSGIEPKVIVNAEPRFSSSLPRSILRNVGEKSPIDVDALAAAELENRPEILPASEQAFPGKVMERHSSPDCVGSDDSVPVILPSKDGSPRRVSRFKMSRAHLDH
ncbi:unnamed protein product [Gongylonema pulchrum]|uniref:Shugoshin_C domain-containing protein n=1 Tax=Gongylonema pulchrum TaxID=637853 RepID=A0A183DRV1_9BILA|nr:unnamed protein product [Gongylonema pulchrum]